MKKTKGMKKRIASLLMVAVMMWTTIDVSVFATEIRDDEEEAVLTGECNHILNDTGTQCENCGIPGGYCGAEESVIWTYDDSTGCLTISGSGAVSEAGWSSYMNNIITVDIKEGITNIAGESFFGCTLLESVNIPDGVTDIQTLAFYSCTALKNVTIPGSVSSVRMQAFSGCTSLESVTFSKGITMIGEGAFENCTSLESITIPDSVTSIGQNAFGGCTKLASIEVDEANTVYKDIDGNLYTKDGTKLIGYATGKNDTEFQIPEGVTVVGEYACSGAAFENLIIPRSVESVDATAFQNCKALSSAELPCAWSDSIYKFPNSVERTYYHRYGYSAEDNTITATCKDCGNSDSTAILIAESGPYEPVYSHAAIVEPSGIFVGKEWEIVYIGRNNTSYNSTEVPYNVGEYTAMVAFADEEENELIITDDFEITKATPDIGKVTAEVLYDTTNVLDVELSRANNTVAGTLELIESKLQYGENTYQWKFTPTGEDAANYTELTGTINITVNDTIPPTATYWTGLGEWKEFIGAAVFGFFTKDYQAVRIRCNDGDDGSGVASIQYCITHEELVDFAEVDWNNYEEEIVLNDYGAYFIYVKVTDNAGNMEIMNTEGIVIYSESVIGAETLDYLYKKDRDAVIPVTMNGNTVAGLRDDNGNEVDSQNYTVENDKITLHADYLNTLNKGEYTYEIYVNPQGVENAEVMPAYRFDVNVMPRELTVFDVAAAGRDYIANDPTVEITNVALDGIQIGDSVSVELTGVKGTLSSADADTYTRVTLPALTLSGADKDNYVLIQPTEPVVTDVTIEKADTMISIPEGNKTYNSEKTGETVAVTDVSEEYGTPAYRISSVTDDYEIISGEEVSENGVITYNVSAPNENVSVAIAQIVVDIEMKNYKTMSYVLNIRLTTKDVQEIVASNMDFVYGDADMSICVEGAQTALTYKVVEDSNADGEVISVDEDGTIHVVNAGNAIVRITAEETEDWAGAVCEIAVTVAKGTTISGAPQNQMGVSSEIATTDGLVLPENWEISDADAGKELPYNKQVAVVVVYTGADTDNYEETALTKTITVTRICNHEQTEVKGIVAASCSKEGYTGDTYCTVCESKVKTGVAVARKAHTYNEGKITKAATCAAAGVKTFTCTGCGVLKTESVAKTVTHTYDAGKVTKKATATKKGVKTYTCAVCKATKTEDVPALGAPKKGTKVTISKAVYKVTKSSLTNGTVTYVASKDKKATSITIPATVKIDGVTFKVTAIEKNVFKGNKKIKTVTIGKNVAKIGASAFYGCSKLKKLTIKSAKLSAKTIGSKAFTKTPKSINVYVPKKKYKAYKSMLIGKGVNKKAKFKKQ